MRSRPTTGRYDYTQDRFTGNYTVGLHSWTFESRFGFNANTMARLDQYLLLKDPEEFDGAPAVGPQPAAPRRLADHRASALNAAEIWDMDGQTYSFDQKLAHQMGKHTLKFGARYGFNGGFRSNPENPEYLLPEQERLPGEHPQRGDADLRIAILHARACTSWDFLFRTIGA